MYPPSKQSSALEDRGSSSLPEPVCFSQTPSSSSPRGAETWKCQMSVVTVSWVKHRWALLGLGWQAESAARVGFHSVLFLSGNFRVALFSSAYYSVCVLGKRLPTHFSCGFSELSFPEPCWSFSKKHAQNGDTNPNQECPLIFWSYWDNSVSTNHV